MSVKAAKAKRKNGKTAPKSKRGPDETAALFRRQPVHPALPQAVRVAAELTPNEMMSKIENDPDAPLIAKELVALRRERDKSGKPYLTIEQIQAELGRDDSRYGFWEV